MSDVPELVTFPKIREPKKRAFLVAYALTGYTARACELAGITRQALNTSGWLHDTAFQEAKEEAFRIAADLMEDEARARAIEGMRQYKFHKGEPVEDPNVCDCGHDRREWHVKGGPCSAPDCECEKFTGQPYFEDSKSDNLLKFLLTGAKPERYGQKLELRGALANLDMTKLAPEHVARIAAGEHPLQVLATAAEGTVGLLGDGEESEDEPEAHADDDVSL